MSFLRGKKIGFIGAGTMGQALIRGLLAKGIRPRQLSAIDPSSQACRRLRHWGVSVSANAREPVLRADTILLAVKPQEMAGVLTTLAPNIHPRQCVISIAAGITLKFLQERLPGAPVIRVMPNLPATIGCGFSAMSMGRWVRPAHRRIATEIFKAVGEVVEVPERFLDAITAVSGSGPAYVFFFAQMWEEAARTLGLSEPVSRRAVWQTLQGSVQLLTENVFNPSEWIVKVASKKGTTEAALRVLTQRRIKDHFLEALQAAARRSKELSINFAKQNLL